MKIQKFIKYIADKLQELPEGSVEAILIASHILEMSRTELHLNHYMEVHQEKLDEANALIHKRKKRYPLQYLLGSVDFYNAQIMVNPSVLIPRPETELLVETILKENPSKKLDILDLCTGSGAIAIALKIERSLWNIDATDISKPALKTAIHNAINNNTEVHFIESDVFKNISKKYDLIISNPPYISNDDYKKLEPELKFEPAKALVAENNGLFFYEKILKQAQFYLKPSGRIYLEIGADQAGDISKLAQNNNFNSVSIKKDYNDFDRFAILTRARHSI